MAVNPAMICMLRKMIKKKKKEKKEKNLESDGTESP